LFHSFSMQKPIELPTMNCHQVEERNHQILKFVFQSTHERIVTALLLEHNI
jgi:hypothetical protein